MPSRPDRSSSRGRRLRRHLALGALALAACVTVDLLLDADDLRIRLSMSTAYASLLFVAASLAVGPIRVLRGRHAPANIFVRRDLGIWAGALGLLHAAAGLTVHFRGDMWKYFFSRFPSGGDLLPLRGDLFGLATYTGVGAGLVLVLLLALSNDWSLRTLGTARWKSLQRWNYGAFVLTVVHGVAFQQLESRSWPFVLVFAVAVLAVFAAQAAGTYSYRRR